MVKLTKAQEKVIIRLMSSHLYLRALYKKDVRKNPNGYMYKWNVNNETENVRTVEKLKTLLLVRGIREL